MAQSRYIAAPTASHAPVEIALAAATRKTLLQVATPSTQDITLVSMEISFDGVSATAEPVVVDLIETNVAATVTALTPSPYSDPNAPASLAAGGTALTGYNASAEGTITASRIVGNWNVPPTSGLLLQWPLGREPGCGVSKFLRLRALASASVNALVELVWEE